MDRTFVADERRLHFMVILSLGCEKAPTLGKGLVASIYTTSLDFNKRACIEGAWGEKVKRLLK